MQAETMLNFILFINPRCLTAKTEIIVAFRRKKREKKEERKKTFCLIGSLRVRIRKNRKDEVETSIVASALMIGTAYKANLHIIIIAVVCQREENDGHGFCYIK